MEVGSQGGFHVWLHLRTRGLCAAGAVATLAAHTTDGREIVMQPPIEPDLEVHADRTETAAPERLILCQPPVGIDMVDQPFDVTATVEDEDGRQAMGRQRMVARCPTSDQAVLTTCRFVCNNTQ